MNEIYILILFIYFLFLEHDAHNEIITVQRTEKGVRLKDIYTTSEIFN